MNFLTVLLIGAVFGVLDGVGIFFEPKEPYKWQILFAATLKGILVALLTGFSLAATTRWWSAMVTGALYGFAFSLVIYLAKGGPRSGDAPYVIPSGIITGGFTGLFILIWAAQEDLTRRCKPTPAAVMTSSQHVYEVRPRKDRRGVDLISDALPFGLLWYLEVSHAIGYAKFYSRSHRTVIRV
jgi:hypothetical protein